MRSISGYSLCLGHAGDARDLRAVLAADIAALVDLAVNEPPAKVTRELVYCRFPLVDGMGNPPWLLQLAVQTVADFLRTRVKTLVYCANGMSRSPCIAGAAVSAIRGCDPNEGLAAVTQGGPRDVSPVLWEEVQAAIRK